MLGDVLKECLAELEKQSVKAHFLVTSELIKPAEIYTNESELYLEVPIEIYNDGQKLINFVMNSSDLQAQLRKGENVISIYELKRTLL